jgi:hypothetical protein
MASVELEPEQLREYEQRFAKLRALKARGQVKKEDPFPEVVVHSLEEKRLLAQIAQIKGRPKGVVVPGFGADD